MHPVPSQSHSSYRWDSRFSFNFWLALIAGGMVVLYAIVTSHVWEDYYITFRSSRNLAEGNGLVFQVGEKVHTFTSPLGVLVPAFGFWITGSDAGALWFLRMFSAVAVGYAAWALLNHLKEHGHTAMLTLAVAFALGAAEAKQISFSSNGMETGLLLLFTVFTWHELTRPDGARWGRLAFGYAALMWTRPDAFIVAGAMTGSWFIFQPDAKNSRRPWVKAVLTGILVGGLLYVPWFVWAWNYYGTPIPQTITAKGAFTPEGLSLTRILSAPLKLFTSNGMLDGLFAPTYFFFPGWSSILIFSCRIMARLAALTWLIPGVPKNARAASLATFLGGIYLNQIMPYPWYFAPWTALAGVSLAGLISYGLEPKRKWCRYIAQTTGVTFVAVACIVFLCGTLNGYYQQQITEEAGRKQIGLWLKEHAKPTDTVFLEPLGYIGYYSQLKTYDHPGLSSVEVSSLIKSGTKTYGALIAALKPDWVVLRPHEIRAYGLGEHEVMKEYEAVVASDRRDLVTAIPFLPGRGLIEFDSVFLVYHRRNLGSPQPRSSEVEPR